MIDDTLRTIRAYAKERRLAAATLAARAGLHPNTLRGFWSNDWSPSLNTLRKLERLASEDK